MTQSPLLGFNNNVKHRGRLFHIQTEDSGVRHPHVITHLFMDGGRILKTIKTSYAEHVGSDKLAQVVRDLMKEQHKMMFIALRDGQFDHVLDSVPPPSMSGPPVHTNASLAAGSARAAPAIATPPNAVVSTSTPAQTVGTPAARPSAPTAPAVKTPSTTMPAVKTPSVTMPAVKAPSTTMPAVKAPSTTMPAVKAPSVTMPAVKAPSVTMPAVGSPPVRPPSGTMPAVRPQPAAASAGSSATTATRPQSPPSSAGMRAVSAGGSGPSTGVRPVPRREAPELFGTQTSEAAVVNVVPEQDAAASAAPGSSSKVAAAKEQPGSGRYAASRPATIFTNARTADAGGSIFGDDLISEKSLDEVILSYLSDDLDSTGSKK